MAMLELECPSCGAVLELDSGFAGGVCRCSNCSTLMTVPALPKPSGGRPARPDAPGGRPQTPTSSRPATPMKAQVIPKDAESVTTADGRTVRLRDTDIPTARGKRAGVRVATALVFFAVIAAVLAICLFAVYMLVTGPTGPAPSQAVVQEFGYDPDINPYLLEKPNVVGLPLGRKTVILVDASASSREWLGPVQDMLAKGLTRGPAGSVQLIYATESKPRLYPEQMTPTAELSASGLDTFQQQITARGEAPLQPSLAESAKAAPDTLILITGHDLRRNDVEAVTQTLDQIPDARFDAVLIGADAFDLEDLAAARDGHYLSLGVEQIARWYRDAQ